MAFFNSPIDPIPLKDGTTIGFGMVLSCLVVAGTLFGVTAP